VAKTARSTIAVANSEIGVGSSISTNDVGVAVDREVSQQRVEGWIDQELRRSSGRVKWKVVPTPTWLSAQIRPPCASTIHCEM
jgi:hypothetical protein